MKCFSHAVIALFLLCHSATAQEDSAAFRSATAIQAPDAKLKALEDFVTRFPESRLQGRAYDALFVLHRDNGNERGTFEAAHRYLETIPPDARMSPYNRIAWGMAERGMGLDSALAYATRA